MAVSLRQANFLPPFGTLYLNNPWTDLSHIITSQFFNYILLTNQISGRSDERLESDARTNIHKAQSRVTTDILACFTRSIEVFFLLIRNNLNMFPRKITPNPKTTCKGYIK